MGSPIHTLESRLLFAFGESDVDFGIAGRVVQPFVGADETPAVQQMLTTAGGKILAGGTTGVARFTSAGEVDSTFGSNGKLTLSSAATFVAEAVDPTTNKVYVLISAAAGTGLIRYSADGKLDSSYGASGTKSVTTDKTFRPEALTVQSDGKVVIAGVFKTNSGDGRKVRVHRVKSDGSADSGFGTSGMKEFNFGLSTFLGPIAFDNVAKVAIVAGNRIDVIGGSVTYAPESSDPEGTEFFPATYENAVFAVARLTSAGALDRSYGKSGIARSMYATPLQIKNATIRVVVPYVAALRADDSVLVSGFADAAVVAEFNPSGTVKYTAAPPRFGQLVRAVGIAPLNDGQSVLVAIPDSPSHQGLAFAAISATGQVGNTVYSFDKQNATPELTNDYGAAAITAGDGLLLIGGAKESLDAIQVQKFVIGKATDPRPDEFAGGTVNDIVKDPKGGLHVAYYDATTTNLMYAHRDRNGLWDKPLLLDKTPKAGQFLSIDVNSKFKPGIAYYDGTNGDLKLAQLVGTKWQFEVVDHKGNVGLSPSFDYDDQDEPAVTYYNQGQHRLSFAIKNGKTRWSYEVVDQSGDDVGRSNALVLSPNSGQYTVAYTDSTTGSVMWARRNTDGTWRTKTAAKTTGGADFVSMTYTYYYAPMIAFFDKATADLKTSSFYGVFHMKTIATAGVQGSYTAAINGSFSGDVFAYNKSKDQVTLFEHVNDDPISSRLAVSGGGKYLSVDYNVVATDLAYVESATGKLLVRPGPTPGGL
jgi:uncharacterized delta-60 repeat protein